MYSAKLGVDAEAGAHAFGIHYRVGTGNGDRTDQYLGARYRFAF